ncbi:MAG: lipid A biosynthesis lauroyl acyltransferase, partial [Rhodospirillales bacterium]|nr:lipid A biosynthesis lauroyl acyltransferase [Rhodospirillales bacterium]
GPDRLGALGGALARGIGPLLPAHRIGLENLRAAYPDADPAWIAATLREAWDNLGRVGGEYAALGKLWDYDPAAAAPGRIEIVGAETMAAARAHVGPALMFGAHLGNWELGALAAQAAGLRAAIVYRMPNNRLAAAAIARVRGALMGRLIRTRPQAGLEMAAVLRQGESVGMLIDQRFGRGPEVEFFGRRCTANPSLARLARRFECPVFGARVIRLPRGRFRIAVIGPVALPRDAEGRIDVDAATQAIMRIIEGWVREHPGQWLWFHRRWRR